jgi:hypothetical protein
LNTGLGSAVPHGIDKTAPLRNTLPDLDKEGGEMTFLTAQEADDLRIRRMILHVVGDETFQPEAELEAVEQERFFLGRLLDVNASGLFTFKEASATKAMIAAMASETTSFESGGQALSSAFAKSHVGASVNGAFFIFELSAGTNDRLYGMLKIDYKAAVERTHKDGQTHLRGIGRANP